MKYEVNTITEYIDALPLERQEIINKLRKCIVDNLPDGFVETMNYGMIGYVVPHSIYPKGYHCNSNEPLPFINLASQKNYIALYHMSLYANKDLLDWFVAEYPKHTNVKLDMGKSCIRFKKMDQIPYDLICELCKKITVEQWIESYQSTFKN